MTAPVDRFEWRYLPGGNVTHALTYAAARVAVCGTGPVWHAPDWYGTGSQTEYERAAGLPRCKRCVRIGATS